MIFIFVVFVVFVVFFQVGLMGTIFIVIGNNCCYSPNKSIEAVWDVKGRRPKKPETVTPNDSDVPQKKKSVLKEDDLNRFFFIPSYNSFLLFSLQIAIC